MGDRPDTEQPCEDGESGVENISSCSSEQNSASINMSVQENSHRKKMDILVPSHTRPQDEPEQPVSVYSRTVLESFRLALWSVRFTRFVL